MREPRLRRMKGFSSHPCPSNPPGPPVSAWSRRRRSPSPELCYPKISSPWIYNATAANDVVRTMADSLKNMNPIDTFHLFGKLPLELRRKIWGFATPPPWIILRNTRNESSGYTRQVPAVLHTCKESREKFLYDEEVRRDHPTYKLVSGLAKHNLKAIFVSMEQDVVMIHSKYLPRIEALEGLKRVALPRFNFNSALRMLSDLPSLENIYCMAEYGCDLETDSLFNQWFIDTEMSSPYFAEKTDRGISKRPKFSYLIKLTPDVKLQSGPLFIGDPVERVVKYMHLGEDLRPRMSCCLFSQGEEEEVNAKGEVLTKILFDMEHKIIHFCGRW